MAAVSRADLWEDRDTRMTNKPNNIPTPVAGRRGRLPPVRVKLWWDGYQPAKVHPPDGGHENWWQRLNNALGTGSERLHERLHVSKYGCGSHAFWRHSELATNAVLAMIEAAAPKDEIEGALAVQMACTHAAAMAVLAKLSEPHYRMARTVERIESFATESDASRWIKNESAAWQHSRRQQIA